MSWHYQIGMHTTTICLKCGGESCVIDSRATSAALRRRRKCLSCQERWTTYEERDSGSMLNMDALRRLAFALKDIEADLRETRAALTLLLTDELHTPTRRERDE